MSVAMAAVLEMPDFIWDCRSERRLIRLLRQIRPDWPKEDIILQWLSNTFDDNNDDNNNNESDNVVLVGGFVDDRNEMLLVKALRCVEGRRQHLTEEIIAHRLFAAYRMSGRVFGVFDNGYVFEPVSSMRLNYELSIELSVYPLVAHQIGTMHRLLQHQLGDRKRANNVFERLRSRIAHLDYTMISPSAEERARRELPSSSALERELDELESLLKTSSSSKIVFCHGNLRPSNICFDPISRKVTFDNFEFSGPDHQAFEVSQHLMTVGGSALDRIGKDEFVPAPEFQLSWCLHYLAGFKDALAQQVPEKDVRAFYSCIRGFSLVFLLQDIMWGLMGANRAKDHNECHYMLTYAQLRFRQYSRTKVPVINSIEF